MTVCACALLSFGIVEDREQHVPALPMIFYCSSVKWCAVPLFGPACEGLRTAVLILVKGPKDWQETSPNLLLELALSILTFSGVSMYEHWFPKWMRFSSCKLPRCHILTLPYATPLSSCKIRGRGARHSAPRGRGLHNNSARTIGLDAKKSCSCGASRCRAFTVYG